MIDGKSIFSWNVPGVFKGNPEEFAKGLVNMGFESVCLKCANGNAAFKPNSLAFPFWGENIKLELIEALRKQQLKIYLWHFLYGIDPVGETNQAIAQASKWRPDGYIWDAEARFDSAVGAEANARRITLGFKAAHPDIQQALCWWALPKNPDKLNYEWHPVRVAKAFFETVEVLMPMMYWDGEYADYAIEYLNKSLRVWDTIGNVPMIPIGRAYTGDGGTINTNAFVKFGQAVSNLKEERNILGVSYWSYDALMKTDMWPFMNEVPRFNKKLVLDMDVLSETEILARLVMANRPLFPEVFHYE